MIKRSTTLRRRLQIVELVRQQTEVRVNDLSELYGVSHVTIRSDLTYLEEQGYLFRSFGKAKINAALHRVASKLSVENDPVCRCMGESSLAKAAAASLTNGQSVFLSAGNIVHKSVAHMAALTDLSLLVHQVQMLSTIQQFLSVDLLVLGGVANAVEPGLFGPLAEQALLSRVVDVALLEITGIDQQARVLSPYPGVARLYQTALKHAKCTIAVAHQLDCVAAEGQVIGHLSDFAKLIVDQASIGESMPIFAQQGFTVLQKSEGLIEFVRA